MKIGIITFHRAHSCGAMLQAWALKMVLQRFGHDVVFPNCNEIGNDRVLQSPSIPPDVRWHRKLKGLWRLWRATRRARRIFPEMLLRYDAFLSAHLPEATACTDRLNDVCDAAVFGSDQIWNVAITGEVRDYFLGLTMPHGFPAISYAASVGDRPLKESETELLKVACSRFLAVSVREGTVAELFSQSSGLLPPVVLDPTLLLRAEDYLPVSTPCHPKRPYLYVFSLEYNWMLYDLALSEARRLGLELVYTPLYQYTDYRMPPGLTYAVSPDRFLDFVANARCMMTDSFHGTALALTFGIPFATFSFKPDPAKSRPGDLLVKLGLGNRLFGNLPDRLLLGKCFEQPIPEEAIGRLESLRTESLSWLKDALKKLEMNHP